MKLEVGMYVRTPYGIDKIKDIVLNGNLYEDSGLYLEVGLKLVCGKEAMKNLKASHNIIDLIEEEDVIKFEYDGTEYICDVYAFRLNKNDLAVCCEGDIIHIKEDDARFELKSIVTKEQFESMKYSLEG